MARYKPVDPHLSKLLPVRFSEQILPGTFEYALNWLVDHEIDLRVFDARYRNDETGASAYHPGVLLKVVLLGYARGLTSSRSIERACRENIVFMALSGDSAPHFTTIAGFVAKLPDEIAAVFRDVLLVCDEQGLIGKELFAVDGCKLPSNASRTWSGTRADLQKKAEKMERAIGYLLDAHRRQDAGQNIDPLTQREQQQIETLNRNSQKIRDALKDFKPRLNRKGEERKANLTDPDSAVMKTSHGVVQGYTGVAAVDAKSQVIVNASAFGTGQENGLLPAVLQDLRQDFKAIGRKDPLHTATVLTDSGYHAETTLQQLADAQINALIADTGFSARDPRFAEAYRHKPKEKQRQPGEHRSRWFQPKDFQFDPQTKTCICPAGNTLKLSTANAVIKGRRGISFEGTKTRCQSCPLRTQCLRKPDISPYRQVTFFDGSKTQDLHPQTTAMKARIDSREGRLLYSRRLGIVEPVFGNLHNHHLRRFTLRTRHKVDAQWKLFALVHNVQKLQGKAP
jgi:transposase